MTVGVYRSLADMCQTLFGSPELPPAPLPLFTTARIEHTEPAKNLPTVGDVLRRLRRARGLTQEDVSALTKALPGNRGISPTSVSAVELWKTNLEPETVESYLLVMEQWGA